MPALHRASLLLRLLSSRFRGRTKIPVGNKATARRVVFLPFAAGPNIFGRFFRGLDFVKARRICLAFRSNRYLALQVRAIDFHISCFEPIEDGLSRMPV